MLYIIVVFLINYNIIVLCHSFISLSLYIYIYIHREREGEIHTHLHTSIYIYIYRYVYIYIYTCIHIYTRMYVHIYVHINMHMSDVPQSYGWSPAMSLSNLGMQHIVDFYINLEITTTQCFVSTFVYFNVEIEIHNILQALLSFIGDLPQGGRAHTSVSLPRPFWPEQDAPERAGDPAKRVARKERSCLRLTFSPPES